MKIEACLSSKSVDYRTPEELYDFFVYDLKAVDLFPFKSTYNQYSLVYNNKILFCNPPFNDMNKVVDYLLDLYFYHNCEIWLLCPVRTDTKWFARLHNPMHEIYFFSHRLKFNGLFTPAPFPSMLVHLKHDLPNNYTYHLCSLDYFLDIKRGSFYGVANSKN